MAKKYRLELVKLKCVRKHDVFDPDEPKLIVNGVTIYGPGNVGKGETVNLNRSTLFNGSAQVQLVEVNPGKDKDLGTRTISGASDVGQGSRMKEFQSPGADYELTYEVEAA